MAGTRPFSTKQEMKQSDLFSTGRLRHMLAGLHKHGPVSHDVNAINWTKLGWFRSAGDGVPTNLEHAWCVHRCLGRDHDNLDTRKLRWHASPGVLP